MKLFRKIRQSLGRMPRKTLVAMVSVGLLASIPIGMTVAEFYPDRQPFDYNKACDPNDSDIYDRCGSLTGPVFNSFINTPSYGDERAFLDARRTDQTHLGAYKNVLPDVTDGSKEVVIRTYVHNNANESTNASGLGIAKNTKVRIFLPSGTSNVLRARSYISADNATPKVVEDTVDFTAAENFKIEYIPGSAMLYDNDNFANGVALNDSIIGDGALIGSDTLNGEFKGCFDYEAVVYIKVKIISEEKPEIDFTKQVRKSGTTEWKKEVNTKPGEKVDWLLTTDNVGQADLDNVIARDVLPPHVSLSSGTVRWIDSNHDTVQNDSPLFDGGINVGTYPVGSGFYVTFSSDVLGDFEDCEVRVRNLGYVKSDQTSEKEDTADVIITKDDCEVVEPEFACDALNVQKLNRTSFKFTAEGSVTNATINGYIFKVDGQTVQDSASNMFTLNESTPGEYTVTVQVKTSEGTTDISEVCSRNVEVEEEPEEPVYSCDLLNKKLVKDRKYEFTTATTAEGGASVKQYNYEFTGNNYKQTSVTNQDDGKIEHTFPRPGTYVVRVSVDFNVGGDVKSATSQACETTVKIPTPEEKCPIKGKENLPKDSPDCKETPRVLVDTGAGDIAGIFVATTFAGALAHRFLWGRRYNA